ncbi:MAG: MBL fold metallo-hydrolase RNA specificity domain-containing protein [Thermoplasmata archaeon]
MKITIFDGHGTIGGNKIYIEENNEGIFLDFGMNFSSYGKYYEEFITERPSRGIYDLWRLGLIPKLNIYRDDLIPDDLSSEILKSDKIPVKMVLISHAHLDHAGNVSLLRNDIPILGSPETLVILKSIRDTSSAHLGNEIPYSKERIKDGFLLKASKNIIKRKMFVTDSLNDESINFLSSMNLTSKENENMAEIDDFKNHNLHFEFKPFIVDHSIPGATSFLIKADFEIAYTGDLRFHGKRKDGSMDFFKNAKNARILITEGTRIGRADDTNVSEELVYENSFSIINESNDLVISDFSPRNFERLETFKKIAEKTGRSLVITTKDAYYLDALDALNKTEMMKNLKIYSEYSLKENKWQSIIYDKYGGEYIYPNDIKNDPSNYILCFSFYDMPKLLDIMPNGGDYIYSSSEAFGEEDIFSFERLLEWIKFFNFKVHGIKIENNEIRFEKGLHASGHASKDDLIHAIDIMDPDLIIPVHTENPDWFLQNFENVKIIKNGKDLTF